MRILLLGVVLLMLAGVAGAGSRDAPEVVDAAGDCSFAPGNEYADIVASWISEETASEFTVNIQLAKWAQDALASYAGYTVQFTHQGVQWGVAALYDPQGGWQWSTGFIDTQTGQMANLSDTTGSWDASTATMSIQFQKTIFPHAGSDNRLTGFVGGSADMKKDVPFFAAQGFGLPVAPGDFLICDTVQSDAVYEFTVGQHTMQAPSPSTDASPSGDEGGAPGPTATPTPAPDPGPARNTPGLGVAAGAAVLACLAAATRRR